MHKVEQMTSAFVETVRQLPADKIGAKKDEGKRVGQALDYLAKYNILPPAFGPKAETDKLIKEQRWGKK